MAIVTSRNTHLCSLSTMCCVDSTARIYLLLNNPYTISLYTTRHVLNSVDIYLTGSLP